MSTSKKQTHLWSGDWESESANREVQAPPAVTPQAQNEPTQVQDEPTQVQETQPQAPREPGERRSGRSPGRWGAIAALVAVAAVALGGTLAALDGGGAKPSRTTAALPAAP